MEQEEESGQAISREVGDWYSLECWDTDGGRPITEKDRPEQLDVEAKDYERVEHDPFSPENFNKVVLVQLARLYDLQLAFLSLASKDMANYIASLHEHGEFFGPDPAILLEEGEA